MAGYSSTDIKEYIERGLAEVSDLINRREYNSSVVKARKVAGSIVSSYAAERNIPAEKLADTIETLYTEGAINMTSRDDFHSLRLYGSKAVHDRDCTEEDARHAYYFLNNEVQTYLSRKNVSVDRTPVRIDRSQIASGYGQRRASSGQSSSQEDERKSTSSSGSQRTRNTARRRRTTAASQTGRTSGTTGTSGARRRASSASSQARSSANDGGGFGIYDILKVLIPVVVVILLIIIIRSLLPSDNSDHEATPAVETAAAPESEETAADTAETEPEAEPETEAVVYEYKIKGTNVNIRYADNQDRVYTQLNNGYVIGTITEIDGSDFVQFTLDGVNVVVHKDYIEPVTE